MKVKVGVGGNDALEIDVLGMDRHVMDTRWAGWAMAPRSMCTGDRPICLLVRYR